MTQVSRNPASLWRSRSGALKSSCKVPQACPGTGLDKPSCGRRHGCYSRNCDTPGASLCRIPRNPWSVRRDCPVSFDLPKIERPADAVAASAAILDAVSEGALTPGEAAAISKLIEGVVKGPRSEKIPLDLSVQVWI